MRSRESQRAGDVTAALRRPLVVFVLVVLLIGGVSGAAVAGSVSVTARVMAPEFDFAIVGVEHGRAYNTPVTPGVTSTDSTATYHATLNGEPFTLGSAVIPEGTYLLLVTGVNQRGSVVTRGVTFEIDYTPPVIVIHGVVEGLICNHALFAVATVNEDATVTYLLNGRAYEPGMPITEEGDYHLEVVAVDRAGNIATEEVRFSIDLTPPELLITGVVDGQTYNHAVAPHALCPEPSAVLFATLNGAPFTLGSTVLAPGEYTLAVTATDLAGNTTVVRVVFVIDYSVTRVDIDLSANVDRPSIALDWEVIRGPEPASYRVVRAHSDTQLQSAFALAETTSTVYVDDQVRAGTAYYYRITALDDQGSEIGESNVATAAVDAELVRVWGENRIETAARASQEAFESSDVVIVATRRDFADALSAASLAGSYRAPILLTNPGALSSPTREEIVRLGASRAIIVGGTIAVGTPVELTLRDAGLSVDRIAGVSRYETSVAIAIATARNEAALGRPRPGQVFLARGDSYPDALSVSPLAYALRAPILLTRPNTLPAAVQDYVAGGRFASVVISGGPAAVSEAVAAQFVAVGGMDAVRIGGSDRYATSSLISVHGVQEGWASWRAVGVATGRNFPDALAGSVLMGELGGVLMITPPNELHTSIGAHLAENEGDVFDVRIFGGTLAVGSAVEDAISQLLP